MKTVLSVNINKVALIRNSREENFPDLIQFAKDCEEYGAQGITVHPRPDERHVKYSDLVPLKKNVTTEFNIEGYPSPKFMDKVIEVKPHQCTLVPDSPDVLTSNEGWNTKDNLKLLQKHVNVLHTHGIRVSLFLNPELEMVKYAKDTGADRIEFYTGNYAKLYPHSPKKAIKDHVMAAKTAKELGLGINAGHDLNLENLSFYVNNIPSLMEVSIGHAIVSDALYYGIQNTIQMYLHQINRTD